MRKYRKLSLIIRGCSPKFKEIFERKVKYGGVNSSERYGSIRSAAMSLYRSGSYLGTLKDDAFIYKNYLLLPYDDDKHPFKETKQDSYA